MNETFVAIRNVAETNTENTTTAKSLKLVLVEKMEKVERVRSTFCLTKRNQPRSRKPPSITGSSRSSAQCAPNSNYALLI